jgi:hypothetical protein
MADIPAGMYGRDQTRAELHAALCEHYGLTREQTQDVTDHMDRLDHHEGGGATALHKALQDLWDKYPLANAPLSRSSTEAAGSDGAETNNMLTVSGERQKGQTT